MTTELKQLIADNSQKFETVFGHAPTLNSAAPGRINVIGEHTDYNLGLSMPAAINRWVIISFSYRNDNQCVIQAESFGTRMQYEIGSTYSPAESWTKYIWGALDIFQKTGNVLSQGFNAYVWGNVPLGAGVSSSATLEVAFMNLLRHAYKGDFDDVTLVKYCQKIEHEYVGVKSGLLDQYASKLSKAGKLMILDFQSLTHEYVDADMGEWCWVLAHTKVKRELAGSKYSERVQETQQALIELSEKQPHIKGFRDITLADVALLSHPVIKNRIAHFVNENERVHRLAAAFKAKNMPQVGAILIEGHESLSKMYEVSCPELDFYIETAKNVPGWAGGRMMGGGFGGCTINLVKKQNVDDFKKNVLPAYEAKFGIKGEIYVFDAVEGAQVYGAQ